MNHESRMLRLYEGDNGMLEFLSVTPIVNHELRQFVVRGSWLVVRGSRSTIRDCNWASLAYSNIPFVITILQPLVTLRLSTNLAVMSCSFLYRVHSLARFTRDS